MVPPPWPARMIGRFSLPVPIRIADGTAVEDHRIVEEVAVAFFRGLQFLEEVREVLGQILVDLLEVGDFFFIVPVMGNLMVPLLDADFLVTSITAGVGQHEGTNACRVGLKASAIRSYITLT